MAGVEESIQLNSRRRFIHFLLYSAQSHLLRRNNLVCFPSNLEPLYCFASHNHISERNRFYHAQCPGVLTLVVAAFLRAKAIYVSQNLRIQLNPQNHAPDPSRPKLA